VSSAAHLRRATYSVIERDRHRNATVLQAARIAAVLGLDLSVKAYPGGAPTRDAAHAARVQRLLAHVAPPLRSRPEVPLPATTEHPEYRAWDVVLFGAGERTTSELEMRLYDGQAQLRRISLKRRDDPAEHFLLVVADTRANRRALREFADLFAELPRLRTGTVLAELRAGRHPPTGLILL
jgi:hypothetical protein